MSSGVGIPGFALLVIFSPANMSTAAKAAAAAKKSVLLVSKFVVSSESTPFVDADTIKPRGKFVGFAQLRIDQGAQMLLLFYGMSSQLPVNYLSLFISPSGSCLPS